MMNHGYHAVRSSGEVEPRSNVFFSLNSFLNKDSVLLHVNTLIESVNQYCADNGDWC